MTPSAGVIPTGNTFVFHNVSWRQYETMVRTFAHQRLRHSYSHRTLEVMSPLFFHEHNASRLRRFVEYLLTELRIPHECARSMTLKRKTVHRGLEPDECFYIASFPRIEGKETLDLEKDPPPDFVIEMEYSRTVVRRLPIYAKLGVAEVWRYNGRKLRVLVLTQGRYVSSSISQAFPFLHLDEVSELLDRHKKSGDLTWNLAVVDWIRQKAMINWK